MHRHGYQGRKFHRKRDQRGALVSGLAGSVIEHGQIETTLEKAKEVVPYLEKLMTKAKRGDLASRRLVIARLGSVEMTHKLFDEIAPTMKSRVSGHLTVKRSRVRRGDNAQLATVGFVEPDKAKQPAEKPAKAKAATKPVAKTAKAKEAK